MWFENADFSAIDQGDRGEVLVFPYLEVISDVLGLAAAAAVPFLTHLQVYWHEKAKGPGEDAIFGRCQCSENDTCAANCIHGYSRFAGI